MLTPTRPNRPFSLVFLLFLALCILAAARDLVAQNADVVILVDGSGSVSGACEFPFQKDAISRFICGAICSPCSATNVPQDGHTALSIVQFASNATNQAEEAVILTPLTPSSAATMCTMQIGAIQQRFGGTSLSAGLNKARDIFNTEGRPGAERVVVILTDQDVFGQSEYDAATTLRTLVDPDPPNLPHPARVCALRFGTPPDGDPNCGTRCSDTDLPRMANAFYSAYYVSTQPRGVFACIEICDPSPLQDDFDTFVETVRGSICALGLSNLPTLPNPVQTPLAATLGQDVTLSIGPVQTTAGLARVVDYQWQRARSDAPSTWTNMAGACANTLVVEGVRPPCGDAFYSYRCIVTTPCDPLPGASPKTSNPISISLASIPDCNHNFVNDICDSIPRYTWTGAVGGTSDDVVGGEGQTFSFTSLRRDDSPGTAVAPTGEVVYTGDFQGTSVDLNPLESQTSLWSSNGSHDVFVTKLKRDGLPGDTSWSRAFGGGGTASDKGYAVAVDQQDGSVYVAGAFRDGPVDFNPNAGCTCPCAECYTALTLDTFITKYSSDGTYQWTKVLAGTSASGYSKPLGITVAGNHDVIVTGWYQGPVDFDPSASNDIRGTQGANSGTNGFVTRLTSTGSYAWTHVVANKAPGILAAGTGVAVDSSGFVYVCGWFGGTTTSPTEFNPADGQTDNCPTTGVVCKSACTGTGIFLMKLDSTLPYGGFQWVQTMSGSVPGIGNSTDVANSLALDGFGNVYLCGRFQGQVGLNPALQAQPCNTFQPCDTAQPSCHVSAGGDDAFLVKFDASTGAYLWSRSFGSPSADVAIGVASDPSGNALVTGYFCRTTSVCQLDFDPASATKDLHASAGGSDVFLTQINADGSYGWTLTFGGPLNDEGHGVAVTPGCMANIWLTGVYQGTVNFDPSGVSINNKTSNGGTDIFISKFAAPTAAYSNCFSSAGGPDGSDGSEDHCQTTGICLKGDVDYNNAIDGRDIKPFVRLLINSITNPVRCPFTICPADTNNDKKLDMSDVPCFVNLLLTGSSGCGNLCSGFSLESSVDCNLNGVNDPNDIADGTSQDCNHNYIPDECDVNTNDPDGDGKVGADVNGNGIPDECEPDCNHNSIPDSWDISHGGKADVNANGVPDECEKDCNHNNIPDSWDISQGTSHDCNHNDTPDECEQDCNHNGQPDDCDIDPSDPDGNGQVSPDCNHNGYPDECDLTLFPPVGSLDCNANGIPDECDIASGFSQDTNGNHIPDECEGGQNAMAPTGSGSPGTGPSDDSSIDDGDSPGGSGVMNTAQQNTGETPVPQDLEAAWEEYYEWAWDRCWGPGCPQSVEEQFQDYVDKLIELGLPVTGPHTVP